MPERGLPTEISEQFASALDGARILVTGGCGFIGRELVTQLGEFGADLMIADREARTVSPNTRAERVTVETVDILEAAFHEMISSEEFDFVFHLAGNSYVPPSVEDPAMDFRLNLEGTFRLLDTLRTASPDTRLIYFSSAAVYGNPVRMPMRETDPTVPNSPYGVAKLAAERYVAVFSGIYGLRAASLRVFSCYGPGQRKQLVFDFVDRLHNDPRKLVVLGDGSQARDFVYVGDAARAALTVAARGPLEGEAYNVASGEQYTTLDLAAFVADAMGVQPEIELTGSIRPGDADRWLADLSRLGSLEFAPSVSISDGVMETVEWYRSAVDQ